MTHDASRLTGFYLACRAKNLRPATLRCYGSRLEALVTYAHTRDKNLIDIRQEDIRTWIVGRLDRVSPETINGHIRVWRVFYNWLLDEGDLGISPMTKLPILKTDQKAPPVLKPEQIARLLDTFNPRTFYGSRNRNITLVLLDTMIRVGELVAIRAEDVDLVTGVIQIHHTKSRRERVVPISTRTAKSLHSYIRRFREALPDPGGPLFCDRDGELLTTNAVGLFMQKLQAKLKFRIYPHLLRHTGVTLMLQRGASVAIVQRICGHSDIRVTQRYSHIEDSAMKLEHDRYSPVAMLPEPKNRIRPAI